MVQCREREGSMILPIPLTDDQKRDIVRLRSAGAQYKVIAREVNCTVCQAIHAWKLASHKDYARGGKRAKRVMRAQRIRRAVNALEKTMRPVRAAIRGDVACNTLGQRIRALRKQQGISGSALARRIGCSEPAVSYWENDLRTPQPQWLSALSQVLGSM